MAQRIFFLVSAALLALVLTACGGDDDGDGAADASTGPDVAFLEECDPDNDLCDQSMELFCFDYPSMGPHCTHECTNGDDCEDPSPGCAPIEICRLP